MNYRQWKKQYKKKYGYNPPIVEDKRKQRKKVAKQSTQMWINYQNEAIKAWEKISKKMIEISEKLTDIIKNVN